MRNPLNFGDKKRLATQRRLLVQRRAKWKARYVLAPYPGVEEAHSFYTRGTQMGLQLLREGKELGMSDTWMGKLTRDFKLVTVKRLRELPTVEEER